MSINKIIAFAAALTMSVGSTPIMGYIAQNNAITATAADTEEVKLLSDLDVIASTRAALYSNSEKAAFHMDGRAYYQGVVLNTNSLNTNADVTFDVSEINTFSCTIGHVDGSDQYNAKLKVYLDDICVDTMTLSYKMLAVKFGKLDVSGASTLKFSFEGTNCKYAIGDISADNELPERSSTTPEYSSVSNLLENGFNKDSVVIYNGSSKASGFNMNGRTYYQGVMFSTNSIDNSSSISFNVEKLSKLSWTVGHVDGEENSSARLKVYIDDDEQSDNVALSWNMELAEYELDIPEGSKVVRIEVPNSSCRYAIADIKADELDAGEEHTVPKFVKASTFIDSGFNNTRITKYTGSSKGNKYNVNGRTYYQGIAFNASSINTYGTITYNVENIDKISFDLGRIANAGNYNATLYIYRDNVEYTSIEMKPHMNIAECEVDLKDTKNLRFTFNSKGECGCALMNMKVDAMGTENDYNTPKYEKVSKFIDSLYDTDSVKVYNGSSKASSFGMNGRTYYEGIRFNSSSIDYNAAASVNVEDIDTISWTVGHVDNSGYYNGTLNVYLDEVLVKTIDLKWGMLLDEQTLDVKDGTVLRFTYKGNGESSYVLADIKADERKTETDHMIPEYESLAEFLNSDFNNSNSTVYDGETPKTSKFTMNDSEFTQGIIFKCSSSLGSSESIAFNTENVKNLKFKLGHVDGSGSGKGTLKIYMDNEEYEIIELTSDMENVEKTIDTSSSEYIYFYIKQSNTSSYAIADVEIVSGKKTDAATTTTASEKETVTSTTTAKNQTATNTTTSTSKDESENTTTTTVPTEEGDDILLGDITGDGKINALDATNVLTYYAMLSTKNEADITEAQKKAGDVDKNGVLNAVDASYILSYYAFTQINKDAKITMSEYMSS